MANVAQEEPRFRVGGVVGLRKKQRPPGGVSLEDAVEEALCFGWIDSRLRHLDSRESVLRFTPRRPMSTWSPHNKARVRSLIERGLMTATGRPVVGRQRQAPGHEDAAHHRNGALGRSERVRYRVAAMAIFG
jgi:uncharacterized protein YdeI (YjbR/CyaY-like superfamily)